MNLQRIIIAAATTTMLVACAQLKVELPDSSGDKQNRWATQGWTNADRHWYHHAAQGTNTFGMPVEWFKALEQPTLTLSKVGLFSDQDYLARFGFIKSPASAEHADAVKYGYTSPAERSKYSGISANAENLPVGFAVGDEWYDPAGKNKMPIPGSNRNAHSLGLTCAACHTGQLEYNGNRLLIDGGPGMISLDKFREALQLSLAFTLLLPDKFDRFAHGVLGNAPAKDARSQLREQFVAFVKKAKIQTDLEKLQAKLPDAVVEGFGRLDALNRIGNEVFAGQMELAENIRPITAPVSYPYIWNAPWFDWVQYNSSIQQPMVRNLGESMGVKGKVNLADPTNPFESYIPVEQLHEMEQMLAGDERPWQVQKFGGLQSPKWSEFAALGILPPLNQELVAQGRRLYLGGSGANNGSRGLCVGCHLPPVDSPEIFNAEYWQPPGANSDQRFQALQKQLKPSDDKYLALVTIPAMEIGTDCRTAYGMAYRTVTTPKVIGNSGWLPASFKPAQIPADCPQPALATDKSGALSKPREGFVVTNFGAALGEVVGKVKDHWYDTTGKTAQQQSTLDGYRPNGIRALVPNNYYPNHCPNPDAPNAKADSGKDCPNPQLPSYRARPLNGVWATAPFLHNGSVPNLYLLLGTQEERDQQARIFFVGSRAYDPTYVGFQYRADKSALACTKSPEVSVLNDTRGLFELDTQIPGNRNTGHLFADDKPPHVDGHIGRALSCDERFAIIEYLKSL